MNSVTGMAPQSHLQYLCCRMRLTAGSELAADVPHATRLLVKQMPDLLRSAMGRSECITEEGRRTDRRTMDQGRSHCLRPLRLVGESLPCTSLAVTRFPRLPVQPQVACPPPFSRGSAHGKSNHHRRRVLAFPCRTTPNSGLLSMKRVLTPFMHEDPFGERDW